MSFFAVTLRTIEKTWRHPNADKLDLAQVSGTAFQFVTGRDQYTAGDQVLYFPIDSVMPQPLIERLGLSGKLAGKEKNRLKTVRLRGEMSQGIVSKIETALDIASLEKRPEDMSPEELTAVLGVTKYDPPPVFSKAGNLVHMPDGIPVYDIEGADQFPDVVEIMMDMAVAVTEKVEGTNFWISATSTDSGIEVVFGQRHHEIKPIEGVEHAFWKQAKEMKLDALVMELAGQFPGRRVTARGEYCGPSVQGNIYKLATNKIFLFDIMVGPDYLPPKTFFEICERFWVPTAPLLSMNITLREWLAGKSIREASNGKSLLFDGVLREGVVIKPMAEARHPKIGRLLIKQRDPVYLAESDM